VDVAKLLEKQAQAHPGNPAIIFKDRAVSFLELKTLSFKLAQSLLALGVQKGDKVGVYLPNCPEYAISYLGTWCSGATCVPLDFMLTEEELVSCFSHAQIKALILKRKSGISLETLRDKIPSLKLVIVCQEEAIDTLNFEGLLQQAQDTAPAVKPGDKDYAIIFYTSGTTGRPKGVLVSYLQLGAPPKAMDFFVDLTEKDTVLCAVPLSHLGGLIYLQNCIAFGLSVVLMERFIPLEFLRNIPKYKVTCFWIVPSMYYAFLQLKEFESFDLSSLRWMVTFGASNSPDALRRFHQFCPKAHLLNGWA